VNDGKTETERPDSPDRSAGLGLVDEGDGRRAWNTGLLGAPNASIGLDELFDAQRTAIAEATGT